MREGIKTVLVTGSRDWDNWDAIRGALEPFFGIDVVLMHGDARGADKMSAYVWSEWGGTTKPVPAQWDKFGKSAGIRRNEGMVLSGPDVVVAFIKNESKGSTHCAQFAQSKGIDVVFVTYSEPVKREAVSAAVSTATTSEAKVADPPPF